MRNINILMIHNAKTTIQLYIDLMTTLDKLY